MKNLSSLLSSNFALLIILIGCASNIFASSEDDFETADCSSFFYSAESSPTVGYLISSLANTLRAWNTIDDVEAYENLIKSLSLLPESNLMLVEERISKPFNDPFDPTYINFFYPSLLKGLNNL